jgi:hypothetical protein
MTGLSPLLIRRSFHLIIFFYLIINGLIHLPEILILIDLRVPHSRSRLRHCPTFLPPASRTNLIRFSPLSVAVRMVNRLIDQFDLDIFCNFSDFMHFFLPLREEHFI